MAKKKPCTVNQRTIKKEKHTVPLLNIPIRLSDYAGGIFKTIPSRKGMKKAIDKGVVSVNGTRAETATLLFGGEVITLISTSKENKPILTLDLEICFENDHLAIINKPPGILVSGNKKKTIVNALPHNLKKSSAIDALDRPKPVHRLDFPTSGLLLVAKSYSAMIALNKLFKTRSIQKTYFAITYGSLKSQGTIQNPIDGKKAYTEYKVIKSVVSEKFEYLNLVTLFPKTGRKHQLRIHLSQINSPILGDKKYGKKEVISSGKGLYLHASKLIFKDPISNEIISVESKLPKKFTRIFDKL
ncbi:RluA family pseudouridine synthase [Marixanthomonas sp. SCSIO 43207]|uniref:RluA family pseudouridine synthase n=1 Tax=Marixanthomonas sp. SCSIO 43207 TaxID=2779360 RepID=UPI002102EC7F|nr:RluA family pseudouridine synthase [Marixanthomonas sp. SCSIO 43207]